MYAYVRTKASTVAKIGVYALLNTKYALIYVKYFL